MVYGRRCTAEVCIQLTARPCAPPLHGITPNEAPADYYGAHPAMEGTATAALADCDGGGTWWQRTKRIYARRWKKTDPVLPAQPAMLGLTKTAASLTAHLTGVGLVAAPYVFSQIGWSAIALFLVFAALAEVSVAVLSYCCEFLELRFVEYRRFHWYTQYPDIASRALGPRVRKVVVIWRLLCVVGIEAVLVVLTAECLADWLNGFLRMICIYHLRGVIYCCSVTGVALWFALFVRLLGRHLRYWCTICVLPFSVALLTALLTGIAESRLLRSTHKLVPSTRTDGHLSGLRFSSGVPSVHSLATSSFVSLGVLAFIYGSVYGFMNIRRDMKTSKDFTIAATYAIAGNTLACLLVGAMGYAVFGGLLNGNVVLSLTGNNLRLAAGLLVIICTEQGYSVVYVILDELDSPQLNGQRVAGRRAMINTALALPAGLLALAVPYLAPLMALVGALVLCPVVFVLPPIFYFKLLQESPLDDKQTLILLALSVVFGVVVTIGGTVAAIMEIVDQSGLTPQNCFSIFSYDEQFNLAPSPQF